jgi:HipA-like C-terminal domain
LKRKVLKEFEIIRIDSDQVIGDEALGTKTKFWIEHNGEDWLFKEARANTGEDWSEKLAAEIAHLLDISAAHIELTRFKDRPGTISQTFVNRRLGEDLIHGNEILGGQVFGYDPGQRWGQSRHTVENITNAIRNLFPDEGDAINALSQLASYLVLDGLIGNVDRHHENWGVLASRQVSSNPPTPSYKVAPSFDHASSLGRELLEDRLQRILNSQSGVESYVLKGRGAIYLDPNDKKGQNPLYLVELGAKKYPEYFKKPLDKLKTVPLEKILALVNQIPADRISPNHAEFVTRFISYTYKKLCNINL